MIKTLLTLKMFHPDELKQLSEIFFPSIRVTKPHVGQRACLCGTVSDNEG